MKKFILILTAVLVLLFLAARPLAPAASAIDWWAVGPSSSRLSSGTITIESVVGQGIAGRTGEGFCTGYLCIFADLLRLIYLPFIMK